MEFITRSVNQDITDFEEWIDTYICKYSSIYREFKAMMKYIPWVYVTGEISVTSPYHIWINMLRSPNIELHKARWKCHRYYVKLDGMTIATIDKFKYGYKYTGILGYLVSNKLRLEYKSQLV